MSRGLHATREQQEFIAARAQNGCTAAQVYREMDHRGLLTYPNPTLGQRSIDRLVTKARIEDTSPRWSFLDAEPEQARLVLSVACWVMDLSGGRAWISKDRAEWVAKLVATEPEIPPHWAFVLALGYQVASKQDKPDSRVLDMTLGSTPWVSAKQRRDWGEALKRCGAQIGLQLLDPRIRDIFAFMAKVDEDDELWELWAPSGEPRRYGAVSRVSCGAGLLAPATYPPGFSPSGE